MFGVMTLLVDWNAGSLTPVRILLWLPLSAVVFAVLLPPRVSAGPGRLVVRTLRRRTTVHTDALSAVRYYDAVSSHLILRDAFGNRLQIDTRTLAANPLLWHELDTGAHRSLERGTLRYGADILDRLGERIDDDIMRGVLGASGLSCRGPGCRRSSR